MCCVVVCQQDHRKQALLRIEGHNDSAVLHRSSLIFILTGYWEGFIITGVVICMTPISMLWQPSWDVYIIVVDMSDPIHKVQS